MAALIDLSGQRFGNLLVTERAPSRAGRVYWKCLHDNGDIWEVCAAKLRSGHTSGKASKQRHQKMGRGEAAKNAALVSHRHGAKRRGIEDTLTDEKVFELHASNCFYCDSPPSNKKSDGYNGDYLYNGIDRVDNNQGYVSTNCVPCCKYCNVAKGTQTTRDFLLRSINIADRFHKVYEDI